MFILYLLAAGAVFGLLYWLITYLEGQFPGAGSIFFRFARIALVVLAVIVVIFMILSLLGGPQIIVFPRG